MKQLLLSFLFAASLAGVASAQAPFTFDPLVTNAVYDGIVLNSSTDLTIHATVTNTSADTIQLKWVREIPASCPPEWLTQVCDNNFCFGAASSTNVDLAASPPVYYPFRLLPGEVFPDFILHVRPVMTAGCCPIKIHFSELAAPDVVLLTAEFNMDVNSDCGFVGTKEEAAAAAVRAHPNPAGDWFELTGNAAAVKQVSVSNLLGRQVKAFAFRSGERYDIGDLADGLYLVSLRDAQGRILHTQRLTRRATRP